MSIPINWKLLNSSTIISSGFISFNLVNNGIPIFPPKCTVYPASFKIWYVNVVVVVFPSLPVMPITLQGAIFISCSISVVTIAPLFFSSTSSGLVGIQLGDLKIKSNPFRFFKFPFPRKYLKPYFCNFSLISWFNFSSSLSSNTVTSACFLYKYSINGILLTPSPITAIFWLFKLFSKYSNFSFLYSTFNRLLYVYQY